MRHKSSVDPQSLGLQSHTACKTLIWIHPTQQSSPDRPSSPLCWLCRRKSPGKCRKLFFFSLFFIKVGQAVTTRLLADSDPCSFLDYFSLRFEGKERRQSVVVARSSPWDRPVPKRRAFFSQVGTLSISGWKSERSFPRVTPRSVKKKNIVAESEKKPERESQDIHRTGLKRRKFPTWGRNQTLLRTPTLKSARSPGVCQIQHAAMVNMIFLRVLSEVFQMAHRCDKSREL